MKAAGVAVACLLLAALCASVAADRLGVTAWPRVMKSAGPLSCGAEAGADDFTLQGASESRACLDMIFAGMPVLSFMLLRVAVALRSVYDMSETVMWKGIAFACFTRCIAEGLPMLGSPTDVEFLSLLTAGVRELAHVYGLRLVLGRCHACAEP
mmetsp:Transcript_139472/g.389059  ORF Transcript_139472/g.389059 Transcript_139472/m.389059 type:complete len:154 (-) Transcript_139472:183-644(-)